MYLAVHLLTLTCVSASCVPSLYSYVCICALFFTDNTIVAAVVGGIIATLILLILLAFCCFLYRIRCTRKSSSNKSPMAQNNETVNPDITVNLDVNPSYRLAASSNNDTDEVVNNEYDDTVNECYILETSNTYVDIDGEITKLHCENLGYHNNMDQQND